MPTGYTAAVQDGKTTSFRDFAWTCARAFGALITMRDDPADAPIPEELKPGSYYLESVQRAEIELGRLLTLPLEEADEAAKRAHAEAVKYAEEYRAKKVAERERYEAMIAKVEAWEPPSPDHTGMKKFMLDQLRESLQLDCGGDYSPTVEPLLSGAEWRLQQIARAQESLERSRKSLAEEEERVRSRNKWIRQLRESLAKAEG
jgi:hypothetical protein